MHLRYNCKHLKLAEGVWVKEPIIPIALSCKDGRKLDFTGILDSGSDFILIPKEIADALELNYLEGIEIKSKTFEGKEFTTKLSKINIEIKKGRERIPIQCKAAVSIDGPDYQHIIIGSSFFEHFEITFDYPNNKFSIKNKTIHSS